MQFEIAGGRDNKRAITLAMQDIGTGHLRQTFDQEWIELGWQYGTGQQRLDGIGDPGLRMLAVQRLPKLPDKVGIRERTMALLDTKSVARHQRIHVMVRKHGRQEARQHDRTDNVRMESDAHAL